MAGTSRAHLNFGSTWGGTGTPVRTGSRCASRAGDDRAVGNDQVSFSGIPSAVGLAAGREAQESLGFFRR